MVVSARSISGLLPPPAAPHEAGDKSRQSLLASLCKAPASLLGKILRTNSAEERRALAAANAFEKSAGAHTALDMQGATQHMKEVIMMEQLR